ncbi:MAG: DUF4160 domain-containing protein [Armatimonadota bacterium]|nr:DUF4160 domain-containing protein [Armatimonadota bacterium]
MAKILDADGVRLMIWSNDHEPAHVHIYHGGERIIIEMSKPFRVVESYMKRSTARRAIRLAEQHHDEIIQAWRVIDEKRKDVR